MKPETNQSVPACFPRSANVCSCDTWRLATTLRVRLAGRGPRKKLAEKYAPATVNVTMAYAGMVMRAAYALRHIGHDPTAGLRAKRARAGEPIGQVGPDDVPTRAEALAI